MELFKKHVWILFCFCLVLLRSRNVSGQDHTQAPGDSAAEDATLPGEGGGVVEEPIMVPEHVEPLGDRGIPADDPPEPTEAPDLQMTSKQDLGINPGDLDLFPGLGVVVHTTAAREPEQTEAPIKVTEAAQDVAVVTEKVVKVTAGFAEVITVVDEVVTENDSMALNTTQADDSAETTAAIDEIAEIEVADKNSTTVKEEILTTEAQSFTTQSDEVITTQLPHVETTEVTEKIEAETTTVQDTQTTESTVGHVKLETTLQEIGETTAATVTEKSDDPCDNYNLLSESWRHVSAVEGKHTDKDLEEGWYAFKYKGNWAVIPSVPIKSHHCGFEIPYRLNLKEQDLPEFNKTITAELCTAIDLGGRLYDCLNEEPVTVKGCNGYYIYYINHQKFDGVICSQEPDEDIPYSALFNATPTESPPKGIETPTTPEPLPIKSIEASNLTEEQSEGLVTVELSYPNDTLDREFFIKFEEKFRQKLIKILIELRAQTTESASTEPEVVLDVKVPVSAETESPEPGTEAKDTGEPIAEDVTQTAKVSGVSDGGANSVSGQPGEEAVISNEAAGLESADVTLSNLDGSEVPDEAVEPQGSFRKRRAADEELTPDDVTHVSPTPRVQDGKLQMSFFVEDKDGNVVPAEEVLRALEAMKNSDEPISDDPEVQITDTYQGLASESSPVKSDRRETIWEAHKGLWITLAVMFGLCVLIVLFCLICLICCRKEEYTPNEKSPLRQAEEGSRHPVVMENPVTDDVITRDEAPMVERENPAFTSNGGGQHLAKDEDNGYIVPLHELNEDERHKTDVENTKL